MPNYTQGPLTVEPCPHCSGTAIVGGTECPSCAGSGQHEPQIIARRKRDGLRYDLFRRIGSELERAYAKHGSEQWGRHEFYAILKEEVDELWDDIKADKPQDVLEKELVQVAAMCFRYFETRDKYREPNTRAEGGEEHGTK